MEDDEDVRLVVGDMLRAQGYSVREAADGAQALQMLHTTPGPLHLILTDVMMPRVTGPQFVKHIESLLPTVKVLYMSGYTDQILEPATGQPLAFIQKPFSAQVLIKKIRETLVH
ncbi:MAG: response regulator [Nitrospiraceae bacterium]